MKRRQPYLLTFLLLLSSLGFTALGFYWNETYYHEALSLSPSKPVLTVAMQGIHDGRLEDVSASVITLLAQNGGQAPQPPAVTSTRKTQHYVQAIMTKRGNDINQAVAHFHEKTQPAASDKAGAPAFTHADDSYFADAVFIGDSRTVGISEYSGIENAVFLCKTSLSIFDYDKAKITYQNKKTSVKEVLSEQQFGKIYLMLGINECGRSSAQSFFTKYKEVVENIRQLQPDALIFIQGNLLVTQTKSDSEPNITNDNIKERNDLIATLANDRDIFYIDINTSTLCKDGALVSDYTWDQVHIKAQYYSVWKDFLLEHAIIRDDLHA